MDRHLRKAWPGVAPWEWEAHPEWLARAQAGLLGEIEGAKIKADREAQEALQQT